MLYKNVPSRLLPVLLVSILGLLAEVQAEEFPEAVNLLGLELMEMQEAGEHGNVLISPYSLQAALVMAYAGAQGETQEEMARVLHYPDSWELLETQYRHLNKQLWALQEAVSVVDSSGVKHKPVLIDNANQFFVQGGFPFKERYRTLLKEVFAVEPYQLDFQNDPFIAAEAINDWVQDKTHGKISQIANGGEFVQDTLGVLINAIYLKAAWDKRFDVADTRDESFWLNGTKEGMVPTMVVVDYFFYKTTDWGTVLSLPYEGRELQFVICLPDDKEAEMRDVLDQLSTRELKRFGQFEKSREIELHLPKFRIEPTDAVDYTPLLQELGLKTTFNIPHGSADFSGIGVPPSGWVVAIDKVKQKTFIDVNEEGCEAAAVSFVGPVWSLEKAEPEPPLVVKVDRPFFFAIQHRESGACLFMGWMEAPGDSSQH